MFVRTMIITDYSKGQDISAGGKTFDILDKCDVQVGDFIHYVYMNNGKYIPNPVDDKIYVVTCVELIAGSIVIGFKPAMPWVVHVNKILREALIEGVSCKFATYGNESEFSSIVVNCNGDIFTVYDSDNNRQQYSSDTVADITKVSS